MCAYLLNVFLDALPPYPSVLLPFIFLFLFLYFSFLHPSLCYLNDVISMILCGIPSYYLWSMPGPSEGEKYWSHMGLAPQEVFSLMSIGKDALLEKWKSTWKAVMETRGKKGHEQSIKISSWCVIRKDLIQMMAFSLPL